MSRKDDITDTEIVGVMNDALDDLDRVKAILGGLTVVMDDMHCHVIARHEERAPGPCDDEHPDNRRAQKPKSK
jgi:hypothetical protein